MLKLKGLCAMPLLVGCYTYTPIEPAAVPAGVEVRARITGAASDRVAPLLGSFNTRELVGNVVENNGGAIVLQVPMGAMPNVAELIVPMQTRIPLAAADMVSLERRKVDVARTSIFVGAIVAGVALGAVAALRAGGEGDAGKGPPEPPPVTRIPIWRLHF
ncbi:MAG: hypothetical protein ABJF01_05540 [bacterium]